MKWMLIALVALVATPALAGCVDPGDVRGEVEKKAHAFVDPIVDEHDHGDWAEHNFSTSTMEKIGFTPLGEDGKPYSYIGEMDAFGDLVVIQVLGRGSTPGFVLVDVSDPANPTPVGRVEIPDAYVVDVKFGPEGKRVFAASQNGPVPGDPAHGEQALATAGVTVWNVEDPTNPSFLAATPVPGGGCHMLSVKQYAGGTWAFCVNEVVQVFSVGEDHRLVPQSAFVPQSQDGTSAFDPASDPLPGPLPHDLTWVEDPVDGTPLLFVSHWDLGVRVVDVSDPRTPVEIGRWGGEGAENYVGNVHSAMPVMIGGKRHVVATPELLGDSLPAVFLLDAEDYANMRLVAEWTNPGAHTSQGLLLTTHQIQVVQERLYMAYNHAGAWVLDLARVLAGDYADDPARPEVLGYYLPHEDVEVFDPDRAAVPNTWDVVVKDGYLYATDRYTGFYVLHHVNDTLGDSAITSFA